MPNLGLPGFSGLNPTFTDRFTQLGDINSPQGAPVMPNGQPAFQGMQAMPQGANTQPQIGPGMGGIPGQQQVFGAPGAAQVGMGGPAAGALPQGSQVPPQAFQPMGPSPDPQLGPSRMAQQQLANMPPPSAAQAAMGGGSTFDPRQFSQSMAMQGIQLNPAQINVPDIPQQVGPAAGVQSQGPTAQDWINAAATAAQIMGQSKGQQQPTRAPEIVRVGQAPQVAPALGMFSPLMARKQVR